MARIRTVKPEFWSSEQIVECSRDARLLFIGLWNFCDDAGIHPDSEKTIKMRVFPGDDVTSTDIRRLLGELLSNDLLISYTIENKRYLKVCGWKHQKIDRPTFKYPPPNIDEASDSNQRGLDDTSTIPHPRKGREGKGKDSVSKDTGADAPPDDPVKQIFDTGVGILTSAGRTEKQARSLVGKWRKETGDEKLAGVLVQAANKTDPVAWISKALSSDGESDEYADFNEEEFYRGAI